MFRISSTSKLFNLILPSFISATVVILSAQAQEKGNTRARPDALPTSISIPDSTKQQDGLIGPVRRVVTERAELSMKSGKLIEGPRSLLSTVVYNLQGISVDNTYFLLTERDRPSGKEGYKYDDEGNVTEMTLRNNQGAILSREVYSYEFDAVGNWKKMVTSLVIYEGGKLSYEPVEVTHRNISYFIEAMAIFENSPSPQSATPVVPSAADAGAIGNETVARSDDNQKNRSTVPRGTTVNSGPATDSSPVRAPVTGKQEDPSIAKGDGDKSEEQISKPQARLFSDSGPNSQVILIPNATFPDEAKSAGVTGTVAVFVEIDFEGKVVSARLLRGHAMLQASAVEAALKARFLPSGTNQTSKRTGVISFTFSLVE
ncbi:MAG: energy transducer TonB [Pyrinomonadaceae bacterium]